MSNNTNPQVEAVDTNNHGAPEVAARPIFEEIEEMTEDVAVNLIFEAIMFAQSKGIFAVRDSVAIAKAISVIRPGSI